MNSAPRDDDHVTDPDVSRRGFLRTASAAAAAGALSGGLWLPSGALADEAKKDTKNKQGKKGAGKKKGGKSSETFVKAFYETLTDEQKKGMCFPFDHELRKKVGANWHIVDPKAYSLETGYTKDQQELVRQVLKGLWTEDGYERFTKQMNDDSGGLGKYTCAVFGDPSSDKFEFVLTGRHLTMRADGNSVDNAAFGGPLFYGHAVTFNEKPDHPGNVWWHQAREANKVYAALDGKQREKALQKYAPDDTPDAVALRGRSAEIPGIAGADLSGDQKELLKGSMESLLSMFRKRDVKEVMRCIEKNGGMDKLHMSFYREDNLGADEIWDLWKIEGPSFAWFFRGAPHPHVWLNVQHHAPSDVRRVDV